MANVTQYLQQEIEGLNIEEFLVSRLPGIGKVDDQQEIGIAGFTAFVAINEKKTLSATAPDNTVEDGSVIGDTIFLKPIIIEIEGDVSQISLKRDNTDNPFRQLERIIGIVTPYLPVRTLSQISRIRNIVDAAINIIRRIDAIIEDGRQIIDIFGDRSGNKPLQELFLDYIETLYQSSLLVQIETPYRVYDNMAIINFETTVNQEAENIRFKITAKQIRTATLEFVELDFAPNPSQGLGGSTESEADKGTTEGEEVEQSLATTLLEIFQ